MASSQAPKLAKLRIAVLEHLSDLETHLSQLEFPVHEAVQEPQKRVGVHSLKVPEDSESSRSVSAIDEAHVHMDHILEMLKRIRSDVCSHIPDLSGLSVLSDFSLGDTRLQMHIPSFQLPDLELRLPSTPFTSSLEDVSSNLEKLQSPLSYLSTLKGHLQSLHEHIRSLQLPSSLSLNITMSSSSGLISELLSKLQHPDLFTDSLRGPLDFLGDSREGNQEPSETKVVPREHHGLIKSHYGERLILLQDLPLRYHNNDFVLTGYRFIPLFRWPRLLFSIFQLHNETANIWSHLIPLVMSIITLSSKASPRPANIAERVFEHSANICLASSCVWHVMSGCSTINARETAARVDYVGIGWLISASISSIMYYGFSCRPQAAMLYLSSTFTLAVAGSILPFMTFFNGRQNRKWRVAFFLSLVFTLVIPMAHMAAVHSLWDMYTFMRPIFVSLTAYAVGLIFYAFHFPECVIPLRWRKYTDLVGGGSHFIWHLFIVLAIKLHRDAIKEHRGGIGGEICTHGWGEM